MLLLVHLLVLALFVTPSLSFTVPTSSGATRRASSLQVSLADTQTSERGTSAVEFPILADDGVWVIENEQQYQAFLLANTDKLVILKVYAPWCRACKGLSPKFLQIVHQEDYQDLPIAFCQLSIQNQKAFVQSIGVLALPTIQLYVGLNLVDNFPCGPSKVPILKKKLTQLINDHVDMNTKQLKDNVVVENLLEKQGLKQDSKNETETAVAMSTTDSSVSSPLELDMKEKSELVSRIPYLQDLNLADLDSVFAKAKQLTFEAGSVLMRQGKRGRTFYILRKGEVEVLISQAQIDPMVGTNRFYLGAVINVLGPGDFFGERSLITGEPRAASLRATEEVTVWAFDKDDFPASSVLSGRTLHTQDLLEVNDKYGVSLNSLYMDEVTKQIKESSIENQKRGSVNSPQQIIGVDTEDDLDYDEDASFGSMEGVWPVAQPDPAMTQSNDAIFNLLTRFRMIRQVSQCFRYIVNTRARWGDDGIRSRRNLLVRRLSPSQRTQFLDTFKIIDSSGDGKISLLELKRVMESIGEEKSDDELTTLFNKAHDAIDGESILTEQDFMGIMAEAEFYYLFRDIFASLDTNGSGFVKAKDLDRVLSGVRDLISDDRKSIIDVDDEDMLIDYEQFSRMLLGTALI
jgi:calmodulin